MSIKTLLTFDVEDTWYQDDIGEILPRFFAETLSRHGLRAHFLLVGDRWRRIQKRGERGLLKALEAHDIGLHSDNALQGPFLSEVVAGSNWEDGVVLARSFEERGIECIREVAGRDASSLSRHGNISGGPFSYEVAREKNLFYHYGYTPNPVADTAPVWVNGALASYVDGPNYITIHDSTYRTEATHQAGLATFRDHMERLEAAKVGFQTCFLGHPYCCMSHNGHIMSYHFRNGRVFQPVSDTLAEVERLPARRCPAAHMGDVKRWFEETARVLAGYRDRGELEDVTMEELRSHYGKRPTTIPWSQALAFCRKVVDGDGRLPSPDVFTLGEYLIALLETCIRFSEGIHWPSCWERADVRAPHVEPPLASETYWVSGEEFIDAAGRLRQQWLTLGFLPSYVEARPGSQERLGLGQMLYSAAVYVLIAHEQGTAPDTVQLPLWCDKYPRQLADAIDAHYAGWRYTLYFREDIEPASISRYARLQLWDTCSAAEVPA